MLGRRHAPKFAGSKPLSLHKSALMQSLVPLPQQHLHLSRLPLCSWKRAMQQTQRVWEQLLPLSALPVLKYNHMLTLLTLLRQVEVQLWQMEAQRKRKNLDQLGEEVAGVADRDGEGAVPAMVEVRHLGEVSLMEVAWALKAQVGQLERTWWELQMEHMEHRKGMAEAEAEAEALEEAREADPQ